MNDYVSSIVKHYENCLDVYGDTHLGVDWPKEDDAKKRYEVMLDIIRFSRHISEKVSVLDFGCGTAHLLDFILNKKKNDIKYSGLDISKKFIEVCRSKYPGIDFYCGDILKDELQLPIINYVVLNGVFTEKRELSFTDMWDYFRNMLIKIFAIADKGIAFNVMSKAVDWERDDLFHVPADMLINFMTKNLNRNFIIRNDYGLYEYTTYIYK